MIWLVFFIWIVVLALDGRDLGLNEVLATFMNAMPHLLHEQRRMDTIEVQGDTVDVCF